jgi:hypothetical protein
MGKHARDNWPEYLDNCQADKNGILIVCVYPADESNSTPEVIRYTNYGPDGFEVITSAKGV